jgi:phospholipase C
MRDIDQLKLRELQLLSARALSTMVASNNNIWQFNKQAHHNSQNWYRAVILWYIDQHGGFPDEVGPGLEVKLQHDV